MPLLFCPHAVLRHGLNSFCLHCRPLYSIQPPPHRAPLRHRHSKNIETGSAWLSIHSSPQTATAMSHPGHAHHPRPQSRGDLLYRCAPGFVANFSHLMSLAETVNETRSIEADTGGAAALDASTGVDAGAMKQLSVGPVTVAQITIRVALAASSWLNSESRICRFATSADRAHLCIIHRLRTHASLSAYHAPTDPPFSCLHLLVWTSSQSSPPSLTLCGCL